VDTSRRSIHLEKEKRHYALGEIRNVRITDSHTIREGIEVAVDATEDAEEQYTDDTNGKCRARIAITLESGNGLFAGIDVHRFHNEEIVVERNHRIDQSDEY